MQDVTPKTTSMYTLAEHSMLILRFKRFRIWMLSILWFSTAIVMILSIMARDTIALLIGIVMFASVIYYQLIIPRILGKRGLQLAVIHACMVLIIMNILLAALGLTVLIIIQFLLAAIGVTFPYLTNQQLRPIIYTAFVAQAIILVIADSASLFPPTPFDTFSMAMNVWFGVFIIPLLTFSLVLFLFSQFHKRLTEALHDRAEINRTLENRVTERTTELQHTNQLLEAARAAAEVANGLKTRFLASMSHELRTPLNAIINYTHFLTNPTASDGPSDQQMYLERVRANADHLLGLINDILDLAKIEAGHVALIPEAVALPALLQNIVSTAQSLITDKPVTLVLNVDPNLPVLTLDKTRIRQVMLNLLSNAAKFTEQGTITLCGSVVNGAVELAVRDTGVGIPPDAQERVFAEFQQVDHALNRRYTGTGLGLPISRRLVELHGGTLTLESVAGVGSTFIVRIPLSVPN